MATELPSIIPFFVLIINQHSTLSEIEKTRCQRIPIYLLQSSSCLGEIKLSTGARSRGTVFQVRVGTLNNYFLRMIPQMGGGLDTRSANAGKKKFLHRRKILRIGEKLPKQVVVFYN